jgi:NADH:ubiquinone oxidoreductase subunit 5 (subunit L)/multisubunit Na+/H+ antiporter MnhA subunit
MMFYFIGIMSKSAQFGLHVWLLDAMEGPTPVSALIHAATMVTAGIFLLIRFSFILEYCSYIKILIVGIGMASTIFGALSASMQNDIKAIIAYSTCSQLGYMVFVSGVSGYSAALFHLLNHGFFKALLFLSAGLIIHNFNDEQDIRKMGGLFYIYPFLYGLFSIGSLSLMGMPFLSGYYSKELLLEYCASMPFY